MRLAGTLHGRLLLAAGLFLAALAPARAAQIPGSAFDLGSWSGAAYLSDADGSFSHCAISAQYQSGIVLLFAASSTRWTMGLGNSAWHLQENTGYPISYYVDSDPPQAATATTISGSQVAIELPLDRGLLDRLRTGKQLYIKTASQLLPFPLTGTGAALDALGHCLASRASLPANNPFATASAAPAPASSTASTGNSATAPASGPTPASRAEAASVIDRILPAAGLKGYRYVTVQEAADALKTFDVLWAAGSVVGMVEIISKARSADSAEIANALAQIDKSGCEGQFGSGLMKDNVKGAPQTKRLFTACKRTDATHSSYVYYLIFPRSKGGYYALGTMALGDSAPAVKADADIRAAVYKAYKK